MFLRNQPKRPTTHTAHIGINAHLLSGEAGYRRAGIHQYIYQVLRHLPLEEGLRYTSFTRYPLTTNDSLQTISTHLPTEKPPIRILWEQLIWPINNWRQRVDLLHSMAFVSPWFAPQPTVITVYDLSFIHYPDRFPASKRLYLTTQTRRSCQRARRIITISESGRRDVHHFFQVPLSQIDVVYPGVDDIYQPLPEHIVATFRQQHGLPKRFVLHVGTLQPRKNVGVLLDAFAQVAPADVSLVMVGGKGWLFDDIFAHVARLGLQERVHFTGYVPDDDLPLWYNAASLLVVASVYEGFGLPLVEAMACGTPVIASNISSMPEAVGEAGLLFDPHDVQALADRITAVLADNDLAATLSQRGLEQAKCFSWQQAGQQTADAYRRALQLI